MQPHELKPLRKRLTPARLATRAERIAKRRTTFRYPRPPVFAHATSIIGGERLTNPADMVFFGMLSRIARRR